MMYIFFHSKVEETVIATKTFSRDSKSRSRSREHRRREDSRDRRRSRSREKDRGDRERDRGSGRDRERRRSSSHDRGRGRDRDRDGRDRERDGRDRERDGRVRERDGRDRERDGRDREGRDRRREDSPDRIARVEVPVLPPKTQFEINQEREVQRRQKEIDDLTKDQRTIFVGQLTMKVNEQNLKTFFSQLGEVKGVIMVRDKFTGKHKGFGYVEMAELDAIPNCLLMNNIVPDFQKFPILVKASEAEKNFVAKKETPLYDPIGDSRLYIGNLHGKNIQYIIFYFTAVM
jgi:RNA-binding protein 39